MPEYVLIEGSDHHQYQYENQTPVKSQQGARMADVYQLSEIWFDKTAISLVVKAIIFNQISESSNPDWKNVIHPMEANLRERNIEIPAEKEWLWP